LNWFDSHLQHLNHSLDDRRICFLRGVLQQRGSVVDQASEAACPASRRTKDPEMRKLLFIAGTLAVLAGVTALTAGADTTATFTLTGGALSISAPTGSVSLGSLVAKTTSSTMSGSLGDVTVTDQRGGVTVWTASVISTAFTPTSGPADPAINVSYGTGAVTVTSTVVATPVAATNLTGVTTVLTGASTGISTASWDPTISVVVPANFAPGVYVATITHSVA
jgi:hypothetical protein